MKYWFMLFIAFSMAIISSLLTAFGMSDLFSGVGSLILTMFIIVDLGRFLLFNFLVDEWYNLRKVKYFIVFILCLLFVYSGIGIFSKMSSLVSNEVQEAMINVSSIEKAAKNADIKHTRSEDLAKIAQDEYENTLSWNETDYKNCLKRAGSNARAENNCNNTKRRLDKNALTALQTALKEADDNLSGIEEITLQESKNKSQISHVLMTMCKISQRECNNYDDLQLALSIIIFLVIIGTDYLQIAIVLAVNTRKNKKKKVSNQVETSYVYEQMDYKTNFQPMSVTFTQPVVSNLDKKEEKVENKKVEEKIKTEPEKIKPKSHGKFSFR